MPYVERISDAMFTAFLRGCDTRTVVAERPCMQLVEKKVRGPKLPKPEPRFTERQIEIAAAALANRTRKTNAAPAAEESK